MGDLSRHLSPNVKSCVTNHKQRDSNYLPIILFCHVIAFCLYIIIQNFNENIFLPEAFDTRESCVLDAADTLKKLRVKHPKKVILGHLNINSIPKKFDGIMDFVAKKLDIFLISETKIDSSFPDTQFSYEGYCTPHRKARALGGGGMLMYVNENIPSRMLKEHTLPDDIEVMCVEINLKKQKWVIMGIYRPPNMNKTYFSDNLSRTIDCYSTKYDRILIMGDFNLEPSDETIEILCDSYNLYNLVKDNTCFKGLPKCYDLILTNNRHNFQNTEAVTTGFSDFHKMTVTVLKTEFVKADPVQINYRDYKNYNSLNFGKDLRNKLNSDITSDKDYNKFQNILCEVLEEHAPLKKKCIRANNSPFMTKQLRKMIMNRSRCKNTYFKNKSVENWERYRKLRNDCVKLTRKVKREYFENLNINSVKDNKTFWKTIKPNFTNKSNKSAKIILVENDEIISDNKKIAEIMNSYFVNITKDLNIPEIITIDSPEDLCVECLDPIEQILHSYSEHPSILKINEVVNHNMKFSFDKVNQKQIEKEIMELNPKKAAGYDTIPPKVLKDTVKELQAPLSNLFNTCVEGNIFPSDLKYANVSPLFKKDDNTNKENYRPISILPSISKIFERLMFQQITSYVNNIISPYLCGFRKGYNTQHALLHLVNNLNKCLDNHQRVGVFMMDLSKAFDCIPHNLLIAKLYAYGLDKNSLKLIYSYLKGRNQRVKINSDYSSWQEILDGVPQGSVLGPLLFNLFINDLFYFVQESKVCNYADDNTLSVAGIDIDQIINSLESDINILHTWFMDNGMALNDDKCQFIVIESSRNLRNVTAKIKTESKTIEEAKKGKILGITLDKNINMGEHIKNICKQASNKLYALARISHFLNEQKRKILMKSFVISQFNYCPIIWMYCQRKSNNLINRIHERALRIAYNDYISDFDTLLKKDDSVTIHQRNIQTLTIEIHRTLNDLTPIFMKDIFSTKQHKYFSRRQHLEYQKPCTVTYGLESFGYKASQIWNSIPREILESNDVTNLKNYIKNHCSTICNCNICKLYIPNLGYIENT